MLCPLLGSNCGDVLVLPANVPVTGYVPADSVGVTEHDAFPEALVVAVQDCDPLSVSVTVCPPIPCPVTPLVSVPLSVVGDPVAPVTALTDSEVGVVTVIACEVVEPA